MPFDHLLDVQFRLKVFSARSGRDDYLHLIVTRHGWDLEYRQDRGRLEDKLPDFQINDRLRYRPDLEPELNRLWKRIESSEMTADEVQIEINALAI